MVFIRYNTNWSWIRKQQRFRRRRRFRWCNIWIRNEVGDIDEDESDKHVFEFRVDPELDDGSYVVKVKAYTRETQTCIDYSDDLEDFGSSEFYAEIDIQREDSSDDRAIIVDVDSLDEPIETLCGQQLTINADVYNIGDEDQEQIKVALYNTELGIDLEQEIREDLDQGDRDEVTFTFKVPENAEEKTYELNFRTYYDYKDNRDEYKEESQEFIAFLKITGGCSSSVAGQEPTITATLASEAKVGQDLVIQVSVTNPNAATDFILTADDYESWANLVGFTPSILNIAEDGTGQATLTLTPTTSGSQTFNIKAVYNGKTATRPVSVNIAESTGFLTGAFAGLGNTALYVIAGVVLILIILIIVLIVKVASSKPEEF